MKKIKCLKKILAFSLALMMLIMNMPVMASYSDLQDAQNGIYYEMLDFGEIANSTNYPTSSTKTDSDYIYSRNGGHASVYNSNGYSYLNYFATGANTNHGHQVVKQFKHTYTSEDEMAYFTFNARATDLVERRIWFYNTTGTDLYLYLSKTSTGVFEFTGTNIGTVCIEPLDYDDSDWHKFEFVFNLKDGYLNLYFDDKIVASTTASLSNTPYNIPLKSGFELYEARFSAANSGTGWHIENIEVSNDKSVMPGVVKATYDSNNMVTLSANGECGIKYAVGATRKAAVEAFNASQTAYSDKFSFNLGSKYIVSQATNTENNTMGPIAVILAEPEEELYEVYDFSDYSNGTAFSNSDADANGFRIENTGVLFATVYNDDVNSYVNYTPKGTWSDATYRFRKNLANNYYSDATISFNMRAEADDTTTKRIRFGIASNSAGAAFDVYLYGDKDFTFNGKTVSKFTVADGNWHKFEFLFHAKEKFFEVKFDGEKIKGTDGSYKFTLPDSYTNVHSIAWGNFADGGFDIDDVQVASTLDKLPGIATLSYNADEILLATDDGFGIKYAVANTAADAKIALSNAQIYSDYVSADNGQYVACFAYDTTKNQNGPVKIYGPVVVPPRYICDDFSDFENAKQIPYSGNYNGYSMDNYGTYAKVYNDGKDSYIIHTSTAEDNTNNANSAKRLVRTFEKSYSTGNVRVRFSWKTGSTKRKNIVVGPITLNMFAEDAFTITGFEYPSGTNLQTAYVERFDFCSDGKWHDFTFDFNFTENYLNIYADDMLIEPYNCYWTSASYGSKPAKNIPLKEDAVLEFAKFCSYDKDEWFCIDNVQVTNDIESMPSKVTAKNDSGVVTLSTGHGDISYQIADTALEAVSLLKSSPLTYNGSFRLTKSDQYIAVIANDSEYDLNGPMTVEGPFYTGNIYNVRYTTEDDNELDGVIGNTSIKVKFTAEPLEGEEKITFAVITGLYTEDGQLEKAWINYVNDLTQADDIEFPLTPIGLNVSKWTLKTMFVNDTDSLMPICKAHTEELKVKDS